MDDSASFASTIPTIISAVAAVIQAATAVVVVQLTKRLVTATSDYTRLTSRIAAVTEKQLGASVQPILQISTKNKAFGNAHDLGFFVSVDISVQNVGTVPAKLKGLMVLVEGNKVSLPTVVFSNENIVLSPGGSADKRALVLPVPDSDRVVQMLVVGVDCTDLAGTSEHSYQYVEKDDTTRHFFGFKSLEPTA